MTRDIRSALRDLADTNAGAVQGWLDRVAEDDPGQAVRLWLALLRYVTPTLQAAAIADLTPARNNKNALYQMTDAELIAAIQDERAATVFPALPDPNSDRESPPTDDDDPLFQ